MSQDISILMMNDDIYNVPLLIIGHLFSFT